MLYIVLPHGSAPKKGGGKNMVYTAKDDAALFKGNAVENRHPDGSFELFWWKAPDMFNITRAKGYYNADGTRRRIEVNGRKYGPSDPIK